MSSSALKLIKKLTRRTKSIREAARKPDQYDKTYLSPKILAGSPAAFELLRKAERRMDRAFGDDAIAIVPKLHELYVATSLGRHDYGTGDYGMQLVMPAGLIGYSGSGILAGDYVEVAQQDSILFGKYLQVVAVTNSTHLRLEDVSTLAFAGTKEASSVTAVADTAGSLGGTYWLVSTPTTHYYVWYDDGSSVDPAPGGTGIHITYTDNATAATIATLTKTALDAISSAWNTVRVGAALTVTNQSVGITTDSAAGTSGFSVSTLTQGANANPTPAPEASVSVRFELSEPKKSYF